MTGRLTTPELINLHPAAADMRRLVLEGLSRSPKQLPAWFLYDAEGSRLFELICQQPEYSLTTTETALLEREGPAIAAALMVWGIFTDTISLGAQLETVRELAPEAFNLVADQMVVIAMQDDGGLTIGVLVSALFAFWGASGAVAALIQAMNMGYHEEEKRSFIKLNALRLRLLAQQGR